MFRQVARLLYLRSSHHRGKLWGTRPVGQNWDISNISGVTEFEVITEGKSKDYIPTQGFSQTLERTKKYAIYYNENTDYVALMKDMI